MDKAKEGSYLSYIRVLLYPLVRRKYFFCGGQVGKFHVFARLGSSWQFSVGVHVTDFTRTRPDVDIMHTRIPGMMYAIIVSYVPGIPGTSHILRPRSIMHLLFFTIISAGRFYSSNERKTRGLDFRPTAVNGFPVFVIYFKYVTVGLRGSLHEHVHANYMQVLPVHGIHTKYCI